MGIGVQLKGLRRERGLTQPELAYKLGVHETTVRRWEKGSDKGPDAEMVTKIADVLGTTPDHLLSKPQEDLSVSPAIREAAHTLVYERNGERLELPATQESYEIFREIARKISERETVQ